MLPKKKRLNKEDFKNLRPQSLFRGTFVDISGSESKETKFACVVSKKRFKKAVERNKARRKVYNILNKVKLESPHLIVVYPKQNIVNSSSKNIENEIVSALLKI